MRAAFAGLRCHRQTQHNENNDSRRRRRSLYSCHGCCCCCCWWCWYWSLCCWSMYVVIACSSSSSSGSVCSWRPLGGAREFSIERRRRRCAGCQCLHVGLLAPHTHSHTQTDNSIYTHSLILTYSLHRMPPHPHTHMLQINAIQRKATKNTVFSNVKVDLCFLRTVFWRLISFSFLSFIKICLNFTSCPKFAKKK